jgi:hypothetical protein
MPDGENQSNQNPRPLRTFQSDVEEMLKQVAKEKEEENT